VQLATDLLRRRMGFSNPGKSERDHKRDLRMSRVAAGGELTDGEQEKLKVLQENLRLLKRQRARMVPWTSLSPKRRKMQVFFLECRLKRDEDRARKKAEKVTELCFLSVVAAAIAHFTSSRYRSIVRRRRFRLLLLRSRQVFLPLPLLPTIPSPTSPRHLLHLPPIPFRLSTTRISHRTHLQLPLPRSFLLHLNSSLQPMPPHHHSQKLNKRHSTGS